MRAVWFGRRGLVGKIRAGDALVRARSRAQAPAWRGGDRAQRQRAPRAGEEQRVRARSCRSTPQPRICRRARSARPSRRISRHCLNMSRASAATRSYAHTGSPGAQGLARRPRAERARRHRARPPPDRVRRVLRHRAGGRAQARAPRAGRRSDADRRRRRLLARFAESLPFRADGCAASVIEQIPTDMRAPRDEPLACRATSERQDAGRGGRDRGRASAARRARSWRRPRFSPRSTRRSSRRCCCRSASRSRRSSGLQGVRARRTAQRADRIRRGGARGRNARAPHRERRVRALGSRDHRRAAPIRRRAARAAARKGSGAIRTRST